MLYQFFTVNSSDLLCINAVITQDIVAKQLH